MTFTVSLAVGLAGLIALLSAPSVLGWVLRRVTNRKGPRA